MEERKVLVTANNAMQFKNKKTALTTYCEDRRKEGCAIDVEKSVNLMMTMTDDQLTIYKETIQNGPKVPKKMVNNKPANYNADGEMVDQNIEQLYSENKSFYDKCGVTKEELYVGQYGLITQGAKPVTYSESVHESPYPTDVAVTYSGSDD